jgi:perosamine synthetase
MGIGNIGHIKDNLHRVRTIASQYDDAFKNVEQITLMDYKSNRMSSYWLYPMLVGNRNEFITKLKSCGIPTSVVHIGIDKNAVFGGKQINLINQRMFEFLQIHIPINYNLTDDEVSHIIDTIKDGW